MDPQEPDNVLGDATWMTTGGSASGTIYPARDVDFFGFEISSPGILAVKLNAVPEEMRARIDLYGKNFNFITRKDASNPGDLVTLTLDLASPARYYIGILDLAGKSHDTGYSFDLSFDPVLDVNEPNGEAGDATEIGFGDLIEGYIFPKGDADIFKVYVTGSGILEVATESVPEDMRTRIDLYGKNFNFIRRVDASNPGDLVTLKHDGVNHGWYPEWYYIGVVDLAGGSYNVPYAFKAGFEPVIDENEPNGEIGNAVAIDFGDQIEGYIFPKGDVDFFKFQAPSPGILEVKTVSVPEEMRTRIDLYGKSFNFITRKDASNPGDKTTLRFDVKNPGAYHIGIVDLAGNSHKIGYSFRTVGVGGGTEVSGSVPTKNGAAETMAEEAKEVAEGGAAETKAGEAKEVPDGAAGATTAASYREATLTHSGFDFSEGTTGEYPTYDGEIITWQPSAEDHPDYPRDSGHLWWRNTHLDDLSFSSQTRDMGPVDLASVRSVPAEWDKSPLVPPLLVGHTIVARCYDGYVKFQVISVDPQVEEVLVRYFHSPDATFDDAAI